MPTHPRKLLVEGASDKRVLPELIEHNGIVWEPSRKQFVVKIEDFGGVDKLTPALVSTELKAAGLDALGLIVDADEDPAARWESVRESCRKAFKALDPSTTHIPDDLPAGGLVVPSEPAKGLPAFGVWMMPDNRAQGMLETFLGWLVPDHETNPCWSYVDTVLDEARQHGALWKDVHRDKARVHTWLAWQDPPGPQLHEAIRDKALDPGSPAAAHFVAWFRHLYSL